MWYAFVPDNSGLQNLFCGRTDNFIRFKTYTELMTEFGVNNLMSEVEYITEEQCSKAMEMVLMEFPNYGDWGAAETNSVVYSSELISIESKTDQSIIVLNDMAYEFFHEVAYDTNEIQKMIAGFYKLICTYSLMVLEGYILDDADSRIMRQILSRLQELWSEYGIVYRTYGPIGMLKSNPNHPDNDPYLWSLFDETHYIRIWMEIEIRKVGVFGGPMACYNEF